MCRKAKHIFAKIFELFFISSSVHRSRRERTRGYKGLRGRERGKRLTCDRKRLELEKKKPKKGWPPPFPIIDAP